MFIDGVYTCGFVFSRSGSVLHPIGLLSKLSAIKIFLLKAIEVKSIPSLSGFNFVSVNHSVIEQVSYQVWKDNNLITVWA